MNMIKKVVERRRRENGIRSKILEPENNLYILETMIQVSDLGFILFC